MRKAGKYGYHKSKRASSTMATTREEAKIPGSEYIESDKKAARDAGIKQCRGCREYRVLYKAGYCRTCRDKWLEEHGYKGGGILSSGM